MVHARHNARGHALVANSLAKRGIRRVELWSEDGMVGVAVTDGVHNTAKLFNYINKKAYRRAFRVFVPLRNLCDLRS